MKEKQFHTGDVYVAAAVTLQIGKPPEFKTEKQKVLFVFPISDELHKALNAFSSGVSLNAYEFAQMIKRLRAEMLMRKGQAGSTK
ncbi:MAG: hypothetical protein U0411_06575 [Thermodesulfovibrionales bacterium]